MATQQPFSGAAPLPERFGRYRILKPLGQGGMGSVYLAEDTQLGRHVALKVPHLAAEDGLAVLARFEREARAAATLDHPNICQVYDVGNHQGIPYLTMAYIEGKTLAAMLRDGKTLTERQSIIIVRKLALALHEAHHKGVIHRDLKPANVMVNHRGEPIVMDFGLVHLAHRQSARLTQLGAMMGTLAYMPPEQVRGDLEAMGPGCDIWSLGVILYELLTGRGPFEGPPASVVGQILTQPPQLPTVLCPGVDARLEAVCLRALSKDIGARYASMAEMAKALEVCLRTPDAAQRQAPATATSPGPTDSGVATPLHTQVETIAVACPVCRHTLTVRATLQGKQTQCPQCQTLFQVPVPARLAPTLRERSAAPPTSLEPTVAGKLTRLPMAFLGCGGFALTLLAVVVLVYATLKETGKRPTAALLGKDRGGWVPFNAKEEPPPAVAIKAPPVDLTPNPQLAELKAILAEIDKIPPSTGVHLPPLSPTSIDFPPEILNLYKADYKDFLAFRTQKDKYPLRAAVGEAVVILQKNAEMKLRDKMDNKKDKELAVLKNQIFEEQKAIGEIRLELRQMLDALAEVGDERGKETKRWQVLYDFVTLRLKARYVYVMEYNYILGQFRGDAYSLEEGGQLFRLAPGDKLSTNEPVYKDMAKEVKKGWERLQKNFPDTPWAFQAQRESQLSLGLTWKSSKN